MQKKLAFNIKTFETKQDGFQIYSRIEQGVDTIFLDSSMADSPYSHYSIIGVNPFLTIKYENKTIYEKWHDQETKTFSEALHQSDVFSYLNALMASYRIDNTTGLPFVGGGLGYISYDLGSEVESLPFHAPDLVTVPDAYFVFYDNAVVIDHHMNTVSITGLGILRDAEISVNYLESRILADPQFAQVDANFDKTINIAHDKPQFKSPFTSETYQEAVESMRQYIREGHIYIANMTHTFSSDFHKDPMSTYGRLRTVNPAPFSAYMPLEGFSILSSSPERFVEIHDQKIQTRPIKGTRPRGKTEEADLKNKVALMTSEKDRSELLMIVDLERNDLSKVCIPGSVKVTELFEIETYATVFHLVSTITGQLSQDKTAIDCIKAMFPGGSITGAPKYRAMEIIDTLEKNKRNIYTGSIGYLGFDGGADFNIIIRTILMKDQKAHFGVGGGITWESDSMAEYIETLDKARALLKSMDANQIEIEEVK
jgi:para-aminobenzoate synthetase component 1